MRKTVYNTRIDFQISMPAYYMLGNGYIGLCENHRWSTYDHIAGRTFSNCSRSFTILLLSAASVKSRIVTTVTPPPKKKKKQKKKRKSRRCSRCCCSCLPLGCFYLSTHGQLRCCYFWAVCSTSGTQRTAISLRHRDRLHFSPWIRDSNMAILRATDAWPGRWNTILRDTFVKGLCAICF